MEPIITDAETARMMQFSYWMFAGFFGGLFALALVLRWLDRKRP